MSKELAVKTDKQIDTFLTKVNAQIKELTGEKSASKSTEGKSIPGHGELKNLKTEEACIKAYCTVAGKEAAFIAADAEMRGGEGKATPFKIEGLSAKTWKEALIARRLTVRNKVILDALKKVKAEMEQHQSAEAKRAASMAKVADTLAGLDF